MMSDGSSAKTHFVTADFLPVSGNPEPASDHETYVRVAAGLAAFDEIYVHNPVHRPVFSALDGVRTLGLAQPGMRKRAIRCLAPSGSGKTTVMETYARVVERRMPEEERGGRRPVVIVPLNPGLTTRALWVCVLGAHGDWEVRRGDTEETLRRRAYRTIERLGVELLILDEVQHLDGGEKARVDVTDAIKRVLDDGIVPLALVGTTDALAMLRRNVQLVNRMLPPADIRPLDPLAAADRKALRGFLRRLDEAMVERGILRRPSGLGRPLLRAATHEVTGGVLGRAVNLIRVALSRALRREADMIELCDLSVATREWAVDQGVTLVNPFVPVENA